MEIVRIGEADLCYEIFGEKNTENIILISGLGSQMIRWILLSVIFWLKKDSG
ncbi:hypothetical protein I6I60_25990 [Chryseobacterium gleum]|nr:hypothetical protein I6I60_25990 [Chryseobacterium gleum]